MRIASVKRSRSKVYKRNINIWTARDCPLFLSPSSSSNPSFAFGYRRDRRDRRPLLKDERDLHPCDSYRPRILEPLRVCETRVARIPAALLGIRYSALVSVPHRWNSVSAVCTHREILDEKFIATVRQAPSSTLPMHDRPSTYCIYTCKNEGRSPLPANLYSVRC